MGKVTETEVRVQSFLSERFPGIAGKQMERLEDLVKLMTTFSILLLVGKAHTLYKSEQEKVEKYQDWWNKGEEIFADCIGEFLSEVFSEKEINAAADIAQELVQETIVEMGATITPHSELRH